MAALLNDSPLEKLLETSVLLTSEVVTNAVMHAQTPIDITVVVGATSVRIEVCDEDTSIPTVRTDGVTSGRGLQLVDRLSSAWGVIARGTGKRVWFEVST